MCAAAPYIQNRMPARHTQDVPVTEPGRGYEPKGFETIGHVVFPLGGPSGSVGKTMVEPTSFDTPQHTGWRGRSFPDQRLPE